MSNPLITGQTLASVSQPLKYLGGKFDVGASPITLVSLGVWITGTEYSSTVAVGVFDASSALIQSVNVPTTGTSGTYVYTALSPSVNLSASTSYFIMVGPLVFNDQIAASNVTLDSVISTIHDAGDEPPFTVNNINQCSGITNALFIPTSSSTAVSRLPILGVG